MRIPMPIPSHLPLSRARLSPIQLNHTFGRLVHVEVQGNVAQARLEQNGHGSRGSGGNDQEEEEKNREKEKRREKC